MPKTEFLGNKKPYINFWQTNISKSNVNSRKILEKFQSQI